MPACPFDLDTIRQQASVARVVYRETLASTNDLALELAASDSHPPGPPLLVLSGRQTRGRGQRGRCWESANGSLTFSLLFTHHSPPPLESLPTLALATTLGIARALSATLANARTTGSPPPSPTTPTVMLKWPNDVVVGDRKICGVLLEPRPGTATTRPAVVVGVGVNVNNSIDPQLAQHATSLAKQLGYSTPLTDCLVGILDEIRSEIQAWRDRDAELPERWNAACRDLGQPVKVQTPNGEVAGTCRGIDPAGRLLVEDTDGTLTRVVSTVVESE